MEKLYLFVSCVVYKQTHRQTEKSKQRSVQRHFPDQHGSCGWISAHSLHSFEISWTNGIFWLDFFLYGQTEKSK